MISASKAPAGGLDNVAPVPPAKGSLGLGAASISVDSGGAAADAPLAADNAAPAVAATALTDRDTLAPPSSSSQGCGGDDGDGNGVCSDGSGHANPAATLLVVTETDASAEQLHRVPTPQVIVSQPSETDVLSAQPQAQAHTGTPPHGSSNNNGDVCKQKSSGGGGGGWLSCCFSAGGEPESDAEDECETPPAGSQAVLQTRLLASTRSGGDVRAELSPLTPAGSPTKLRNRRHSVSVTALDKKTLVEIDDEELAEIDAAAASSGNAFSLAELRHLYADFKLNGKAITQQDFSLIFATFSRQNVGLADLMFGMFDSDRSGALSFDGLVRALATFVRGSREEKVDLCFQLLDADGDGVIRRNDFVAMLKFLPMERIKRQTDALFGQSMLGPNRVLPLDAVMEEEETEEAEAEQHKNWQLNREASSRQRHRQEAADAGRPGSRSDSVKERRATSWRTRKKNDAENERLATQVVDEAYAQLGLEVYAPVTIDQFRLACDVTGIGQYLMPL